MQLTLYNCSDNRADVLRVIDSRQLKWECEVFFPTLHFPSLNNIFLMRCVLGNTPHTVKPKNIQQFQMPF